MLVLIALLAALFQAPQTGTIEGTVVRAGTKFPVAGVQVRSAAGSAVVAGEATTDAIGHFILRDVPMGLAQLNVSLEGYVFPPNPNPYIIVTVNVMAGERVQVPLLAATRAASIRGKVTDKDGNGIASVPLAIFMGQTDAAGHRRLFQMQGAVTTDDQGEYRHDMLIPGDYYVAATVNRPNAPPLTVYYPETPDSDAAAPVVLAEGSEVTADIRLTAALDANTFKVSGRILPPVGKRLPSSVVLLLRTQGSGPRTVADSQSDPKTGAFELPGIRQGTYDLFATANDNDREYMSKVSVEIRGRDVEDVEIRLLPGMEVAGRLVTDADTQNLQLSRAQSGTVKISLVRKDMLFDGILKPAIDDTGRAFSFSDVPHGDYNVAVSFFSGRGEAPSPDLYVADIRASGRSVFDSGVQVGIDPTDALEVVIGGKGGSIEGTVQGTVPRQGVLVVLVPEFSRRENTSLFRNARSGEPDGHFQLLGLVPGIYKIFAVPYGTLFLGGNAEFVAEYESRTATVIVQKGVPLSGIRVPLLTPAK